MMENLLVKFEGAGYSFLFHLELRGFEGDPGFSSWGRPIRSQLQSLLLSRKHTGNHLQQVSPFKLVVVHLLLKFCLVCISRLGVKIVESFSVRMAPRHHVWQVSDLQVSYLGCFASLWKVILDQYLARKYVVL